MEIGLKPQNLMPTEREGSLILTVTAVEHGGGQDSTFLKYPNLGNR